MGIRTFLLLGVAVGLPECRALGQQGRGDGDKILVAVVEPRAATVSRPYVCQIHARKHIQVRTLADGTVATIAVKEGQAVKQGDLLFLIQSAPDEERPGAENRGAAVSIRAPFDGLVGRLIRQQGEFVQKGEGLTTLSDNSVMWVYFKVPEAVYLELTAEKGRERPGPDLELILADRSKFPHAGTVGAIASTFDEQTGTIPFRADFPNPEGRLRHGMIGTVVMKRELKDAILIPQRATFEVQDKRYVYAVGADHVARRREVVIRDESGDSFVVKDGVVAGDRIVLGGVGRVRDGDRVE